MKWTRVREKRLASLSARNDSDGSVVTKAPPGTRVRRQSRQRQAHDGLKTTSKRSPVAGGSESVVRSQTVVAPRRRASARPLPEPMAVTVAPRRRATPMLIEPTPPDAPVVRTRPPVGGRRPRSPDRLDRGEAGRHGGGGALVGDAARFARDLIGAGDERFGEGAAAIAHAVRQAAEDVVPDGERGHVGTDGIDGAGEVVADDERARARVHES